MSELSTRVRFSLIPSCYTSENTAVFVVDFKVQGVADADQPFFTAIPNPDINFAELTTLRASGPDDFLFLVWPGYLAVCSDGSVNPQGAGETLVFIAERAGYTGVFEDLR